MSPRHAVATAPALVTYEVINPSDRVLLDATSDEIAVAAVCILGEGRYAAKRDGFSGPLFLFGGHDEWFVEHAGLDFSDYMAANLAEIGSALRSARYKTDRTSLNRIVDRAHGFARSIEAKLGEDTR